MVDKAQADKLREILAKMNIQIPQVENDEFQLENELEDELGGGLDDETDQEEEDEEGTFKLKILEHSS